MAIAGRRYRNVPVVVRSTLQDPPVLTTRAPVVVALPPARQWLSTRPATVAANPPAAVAPPPPVSTGLLMVMGV